jgi:hypothetical protein
MAPRYSHEHNPGKKQVNRDVSSRRNAYLCKALSSDRAIYYNKLSL